MDSPSMQSPPSSPVRRHNNNNNDDDDDDSMMMNTNIPSTPRTPPTAAGDRLSQNLGPTQEEDMMMSTPDSTTGTPLSPIAGLNDDDDDDEQGHHQRQHHLGGTPGRGHSHGGDDDHDDHDDDEDSHNNGNGDGNFMNDTLGDDPEATTTLARGTNLDLRVAAETFRAFLREFHPSQNEDSDDDDSDDDDDSMNNQDDNQEPYYVQKLKEMLHHTQPQSLDIDTMDLHFHNEACQRLYHQLVHYPMELVPLMDIVVQRELRRLMSIESQQRNDDHGDNDVGLQPIPTVQVRPFNLKEVSNLRCLDPVAMDSLVCLKGMIVRCSPIIPDLKVAHFRCSNCGDDHPVTIDRGRISEPNQCTACNTKGTYQIVHIRSIFSDKQLVRVQETPDQVPAGQTPASVTTFCFDDLVDTCQPGDRVEVTGILRAQPVRVNPRMTKLKSIYKTYVDVVHFRSINGMDDSKGKAAGGAARLSNTRIEELKGLSQRRNIYDLLTKSVAPSIWQLEDVKKGILCMLFGGNNQGVKSSSNDDEEDDDNNNDTENGQETAPDDGPSPSHGNKTKLVKRGDVNILLCGDPGTSKSQLLSYVHKLSSRGIYTSGKGSSAVGLTASVVRDPETRELVLER